MPDAVLIISPETNYREQLMPRLAKILSTMDGVQVIGQGATNVKVRIKSGFNWQTMMSGEDFAHCFIEKAKRFELAG